ncbi:MAG: NTP transferase domain-containing protein [Anaerolineales bacterium]|nr:NTP transferase domain-containing protein [Anaerolineales bacterium]
MKMNAIVLAGASCNPMSRCRYSQGGSKALIDVAGKPMVQWIVDALAESKSVDQIIIIGLSQKES